MSAKPARARTGLSPEALWEHHHAQLRDPQQVVAQWQPGGEVEPGLLAYKVRGAWWDVLEERRLTLLATREYEHLVMALGVAGGRRRVSLLRLPHPSGLAVDRARGVLHVASTRNPNMVYDFAPHAGWVEGRAASEGAPGVLLPVAARYLPGSLYMHDLAVVGGRLYANAVGLNAVVELPARGGFRLAWWPACVDSPEGPRLAKNYLQLNSIAAGDDLASSYFSASAAAPSARRPGALNFPVDGRGVLFSGRTREVAATGLTRPHSARLWGGEVWVDNSGYGELGRIVSGKFEPVVRLPGWTRGLCFSGGVAFVGTSRVIPRYRHYAPGLDVHASVCGLHAVELSSGKVLGSLLWPCGNQIFAVEALDARECTGFPLAVGGRNPAERQRRLYFGGLAQKKDSEEG